MIDPTKTYQTRNGRPVRLVAVDDAGWAFGFVGARRPCIWSAETGKASDRFDDLGGADTDLIEGRPKITRTYWLVHWPSQTVRAYGFESKEEAERYRGEHSIVAITGPHTIEFTEGEGIQPESPK